MQNHNYTESKLKNNTFASFEQDNLKDYIKQVVTPMCDVYIINEKTNEKYIKGTQRSDGTFRKDIRIKTDYMPQEENCLYKVKGKLLEQNKNISNNINVSAKSDNKLKERKVPGWNVADFPENENKRNLKKKKKKKNNANNKEKSGK